MYVANLTWPPSPSLWFMSLFPSFPGQCRWCWQSRRPWRSVNFRHGIRRGGGGQWWGKGRIWGWGASEGEWGNGRGNSSQPGVPRIPRPCGWDAVQPESTPRPRGWYFQWYPVPRTSRSEAMWSCILFLRPSCPRELWCGSCGRDPREGEG